ncbi:MAG: hypothetical protein VCD33_00825 [Alphaproteobacteria bacterium]
MILFICTGNIFRSMMAEYALRAKLGSNTGFRVRSAGLIDAPHEIVSFVTDHLATKSIDVSPHQPTRLTRTILDEASLAVAMGTEHRQQLSERFDHRASLFSEIAYGTEEPLLDVFEVVPDWQSNHDAAVAYGTWVIDYIIDGMPGFVDRMAAFMPT